MEKFDLYKDIQQRTNGQICLGIVGPTQTGKSTFVRMFRQNYSLTNLSEEKGERNKAEVPVRLIDGNISVTSGPTEPAVFGILLTTDGSFGSIPRTQFLDAERETMEELQKAGKPFLVVVNTADLYGEAAKKTADYLEQEYKIIPLIMNCEQMGKTEIHSVFEQLLLELPLRKVVFQIPKWAETLDSGHWLKQELFGEVQKVMRKMHKTRQIYSEQLQFSCPSVNRLKVEQMDCANGTAEVSISLQDSLYYKVLSEMTGAEIESEYQLISMIRELSRLKKEYTTAADAISSAQESGYGVIIPQKTDIHMEEPVLIRQGNRYGVKIRAVAPSLHLICAEAETEIAPIVGSEEEAQELIAYIKNSEEKEGGGWNTLIFGKSVEQMIEEGIRARVLSINAEGQQKLQTAMKKIVNKSRGKLVFFVI